MIIVDTMVISEVMRPNPDPRVVIWLDRLPRSSLYTTAITAAELRTGAAHLPLGKRRDLLSDQIEQVLAEFGDRILPFDNAAAHFYAEIVAARQKAGHNVEELDNQIAAIARVNGFAVATRNLLHFENSGVDLVNPWDA